MIQRFTMNLQVGQYIEFYIFNVLGLAYADSIMFEVVTFKQQKRADS
jgi:hypothetical protein